MSDVVNSPSHYTEGRRFEVIEVLEDWAGRAPDPVLGGLLWNSLKYLGRLWDKENPLQDAKKSRWYIDRLISKLEAPQVSQYAVPYEDVLEDYAACAANGYQYRVSLDDADLWDPSLGPVEPIDNAQDYIGQAEWDSSPVEPPSPVSGASCPFDPDELHKDLDQFEQDEVVATFERRGLIFGVDKNGRTYILGTNAETL